jgi:hypothetical protein
VDISEFDGVILSDAINRIYDYEVDRHLDLHYDGLLRAANDGLVPPIVSSAIEAMPADKIANWGQDTKAIAKSGCNPCR